MMDRTSAWPRRRVLAGMVGATAVLGAPAIVRAAPSGTPVKVGGTLSLTGFLAQTAVIHKIASEIMVEEITAGTASSAGPWSMCCSTTSPSPTSRAASTRSS